MQTQAVSCKVCGKSTLRSSNGTPRTTCSKNCRYKLTGLKNSETLKTYFKENPVGKIRISKVCKYCSKQYEVYPYRKNSLFCNLRCRSRAYVESLKSNPEKLNSMKRKVSAAIKRLQKTPEYQKNYQKGLHVIINKFEKAILNILPQTTWFTGDRKFRVDFLDGSSKFPDFIVEPISLTKKVIECFGDYWHTREEAEEIVKKYRDVGYDCHIVWYSEFKKNSVPCIEEILDFIGKCNVKLHLLPSGKSPQKAHPTDAAYDIYSTVDKVINPGDVGIVPCGIEVYMPPEYKLMVYGRSGLARKGIFCHVGTVDANYTGEIGPILLNASKKPLEIKKGDRVAQIVVVPIKPRPLDIAFERVDALPETDRGKSGFGSTGV